MNAKRFVDAMVLYLAVQPHSDRSSLKQRVSWAPTRAQTLLRAVRQVETAPVKKPKKAARKKA